MDTGAAPGMVSMSAGFGNIPCSGGSFSKFFSLKGGTPEFSSSRDLRLLQFGGEPKIPRNCRKAVNPFHQLWNRHISQSRDREGISVDGNRKFIPPSSGVSKLPIPLPANPANGSGSEGSHSKGFLGLCAWGVSALPLPVLIPKGKSLQEKDFSSQLSVGLSRTFQWQIPAFISAEEAGAGDRPMDQQELQGSSINQDWMGFLWKNWFFPPFFLLAGDSIFKSKRKG